MKKNNGMILFVLVLALLCSVSSAAPRRDIELQQKELEVLKTYLEEARDSLQREITSRWRIKQRNVEQRELDKEQVARLREQQERAFSDLSRIKEEVFAKERLLEDAKKEVTIKKDEWGYVVSTFEETFDKEAEALAESNPLFLEQRRKKLESLRREFKSGAQPRAILSKTVEYHKEFLTQGKNIIALRQVIMPDDGDPLEMNILSFGNIFAYGLTDLGDPYIVRQTGKLGADRYAIEKIGTEDYRVTLQEQFPKWFNSTTLAGPVTMDVMQNANTGILISGKKVKTSTRLMQWFKAGGPIMVPLFMLLIWAFVLVFMKMIQYSKKDKSNNNLYGNVAEFLKKNDQKGAREYVSGKKGVVAKVVKACLDHVQWNRPAAEKAVREILIDEAPQLDKHLATLAVIAGAAPLCGLLGTVTGMINLFEVITNYGTGDPKILAGGISEALITTQAGLAVAIPILLIHNFLRNRSLHIQSEMERHAIRILNRIWPEA